MRLLLAIVIVAVLAVYPNQAPAQDTSEADTVAVYLAALQHLPSDLAARDLLVDPRVSAVSVGDNPLDVWEHKLHLAAQSPAVERLRQQSPRAIAFCAASPRRDNCLASAGTVHVMFGMPIFSSDGAEVELTLAARYTGDHYDIQTWRYSFEITPAGDPVLARQELLARGHGSVGGGSD